jgi:hypothetical protein
MTGSTDLGAVQRLFADALDDSRHDARLRAHLRDAATPARIGLYRGNVRAARRRALASAYPVLLALTGDDYFDALCVAYARSTPSTDADLNRFGALLPGFIERYEPDPRHAYFGDVARLEWALHEAAFAADATPLTPQQWLALDPATLAGARLAIHPACAALASRFPIDAIWRAHQPGGAWPERIDARSWSLVVRPQWRPTVLTQTAAAHAAFVALQRGATLDEALAAALELDSRFDFPTQWRVWIDAAAITGLR